MVCRGVNVVSLRAMLLIALGVGGCDRGTSRDTPAPPTIPSSSLSTPSDAGTATAMADARIANATCTLPPFPYKRPAAERVVAIGDLHGDLGGARAAFRAAGIIDEHDHWSGGKTVVVQVGDILDRGDDEQAILDLIAKLETQSRAAGGDFIMLIGNHELMNAAGDFRYVTPGAMTDFDDVPGLDTAKWARVPERVRKRFAALAPGGVYAKKLATHGVVVIVGDTIYSHAGVLGDWVTQIETVNETSRCWLDGQGGGPEQPPASLVSEDSPVWTRAVGMPEADCAAAKAALTKLGLARMVVGHTVQQAMNSACDGTVWRVDVGLAKGYGGPIEVLELVAGKPPKILRGTR